MENCIGSWALPPVPAVSSSVVGLNSLASCLQVYLYTNRIKELIYIN